MPALADAVLDLPRLYVVAAGTSPGWRRASLLVSLDDGASWPAIGSTAAPAVLGTALSPLPAAGEALIDRAHFVDVALVHDQMLLEEADDALLLAGANLALLGEELIQFGRAQPLGAGQWRLSQLVRGRRGTGWAAGAHAAGERFVLIEAAALLAHDPPLAATGRKIRVMASGLGDPVPAEAAVAAAGEALRPPAPVHFEARRRDDGGFDLTWIRSSRQGWPWLDGVDAPVAEDGEAYRLSIQAGSGHIRAHDLTASAFDYSAAAIAADVSYTSAVTLSVVQIGTRAISRPAILTLTL